MNQSTRRAAVPLALAAAVLTAAGSRASAQLGFVGPGSTVQGDILRGQGVFLNGAGLFNYYTAMGDSINADTFIKLNEYSYMYWSRDNGEKSQHRTAVIMKRRENFAAILDRVKNHPEEADLERGDALNSLADSLRGPEVAPSSFRSSPVTLDGDTVRRIPFFYAPEDATISMSRMSPAGKWPVGLRGDAFAAERKAYERAIDHALDQQNEGKLSKEAIKAVEVAVSALADRLDTVIAPGRDPLYLGSKNFVKRLEASKELLKRRPVEQIVGEIEKYHGTTVHELLTFMQRNNLRFGTPEIGDERELYPKLYAAMKQQLEVLSGGAEAIK